MEDKKKWTWWDLIIVVSAAGNEGDGNSITQEYSYPGAYQEVVEVGFVNYLQRPSRFSNTNSEMDLVAPGEARAF